MIVALPGRCSKRCRRMCLSTGIPEARRNLMLKRTQVMAQLVTHCVASPFFNQPKLLGFSLRGYQGSSGTKRTRSKAGEPKTALCDVDVGSTGRQKDDVYTRDRATCSGPNYCHFAGTKTFLQFLRQLFDASTFEYGVPCSRRPSALMPH